MGEAPPQTGEAVSSLAPTSLPRGAQAFCMTQDSASLTASALLAQLREVGASEDPVVPDLNLRAGEQQLVVSCRAPAAHLSPCLVPTFPWAGRSEERQHRLPRSRVPAPAVGRKNPYLLHWRKARLASHRPGTGALSIWRPPDSSRGVERKRKRGVAPPRSLRLEGAAEARQAAGWAAPGSRSALWPPSSCHPSASSRSSSAAAIGLPHPELDMWALRLCWVLLGTLGAGSSQLLFGPDKSVTLEPCDESVTLPCIVTNLRLNRTKAMYVKWKLYGKVFFGFDGFDGTIHRNQSFQSATLVDVAKVSQGVASLTLNRSEAVEGTYTCEVVESNREGAHRVELKHAPGEWLDEWEKMCILIAMVLAAVLYWIQLVVVAFKFDVTLFKKICLSCAVLIVTVAAVTGSFLLMRSGPQKVGLGLIVIPAAILVPVLFFLLTTVFEKLPRFAIILIVLKAIGFLIALVGFVLCASACIPKQSAVVIAGIGIIATVAAIGVIYVIVVGCSAKDHQLPRKAVEEPLNDGKGVMLE